MIVKSLNLLQAKVDLNLFMQNDTDEQLNVRDSKVDKKLSKQKHFHKALLERDPIPKSLITYISAHSKPKGSLRLTWGRFQLTCVLLFCGDLRIHEVASAIPE